MPGRGGAATWGSRSTARCPAVAPDGVGCARVAEPRPVSAVAWPLAGDRGWPGGGRWPLPWAIDEPFPGAAALADVVHARDRTAMIRVLARYAVVRAAAVLWSCDPFLLPLADERRAAATLVRRCGARASDERRALTTVLCLLRERPDRELATALGRAAGVAAVSGAPCGAGALYRTTFRVARRWGWRGAASAAARDLARIAALAGCDEDARRWRLWAGLPGRLAGSAGEGPAGR